MYLLKLLNLDYENLGALISSTQLFAAWQTRLFFSLVLNSLLGFYKYICTICWNINVSPKNMIFCFLIPLVAVIVTVVNLTERQGINGKVVFIFKGMKAQNNIKLRQPMM